MHAVNKGRDVYTNIINNEETIKLIIKLYAQNKKKIIIEEQEPGYRYRIFILNGEIIYIEKKLSTYYSW